VEIREYILATLRHKNSITQPQIADVFGVSRVYIGKILKGLQDDGLVVKIGSTRNAHYILKGSSEEEKAIAKPVKIQWTLVNADLEEDPVWRRLKMKTSAVYGLPENVLGILSYAFCEMLNNAIDHSKSKEITIIFERGQESTKFEVIDSGVGILVNVRKEKGLKTQMEAIQELLKGKQTTAPSLHSGEGIFFTSRIADNFDIYASGKKIIIDNIHNDVLVKDNPERRGTRVVFEISNSSKKDIGSVFDDFTNSSYKFSKTSIKVMLYELRGEYLSRSEARRIMANLDKFEEIILDFTGVKVVGQAFADEIFRVWQGNNKKKKISAINQNENVNFMIKRALT
jgi:anti-sigma regulatory factor (Ser/Thr protein kinase)/biotin operon repressor